MKTETLTKERGKNYGNPVDHFNCTTHLFDVWLARRVDAIKKGVFVPSQKQEHAIRHAVYMICDKLARSANNVMHRDNWDDLQGYSRCAKMVLGIEK